MRLKYKTKNRSKKKKKKYTHELSDLKLNTIDFDTKCKQLRTSRKLSYSAQIDILLRYRVSQKSCHCPMKNSFAVIANIIRHSDPRMNISSAFFAKGSLFQTQIIYERLIKTKK